MSSSHWLRVSSPGRICLFGEHQDYLMLPVIPCAISLRLMIEGWSNEQQSIHIALPDIRGEESIPLNEPVVIRHQRDYFRSTLNVLRSEGLTFASGGQFVVRGEIPINAGTSSSSAMVVSWVHMLSRMSDQARIYEPGDIARIAHRAEVLEFQEPGGMMDQIAAAFGGTLAIGFHPALTIERLPDLAGTFVLGDSRIPKDTAAILSRVKLQVLDIAARLVRDYPDFSLHTVHIDELERYLVSLPVEQRSLIRGTIRNRDITCEAKALLRNPGADPVRLGMLLNEHQSILRDVLHISVPKIDAMIDAVLKAGACGGKINGSGGGGCMFAYAPDRAEEVAEAIERTGGRAYIVRVDEGTRIDLEKGE